MKEISFYINCLLWGWKGAFTIFMSLWKIPDAETVEFMETFYGHYLGGKSIREAFTLTQREMGEKYDPYYWAGFVLVE